MRDFCKCDVSSIFDEFSSSLSGLLQKFLRCRIFCCIFGRCACISVDTRFRHIFRALLDVDVSESGVTFEYSTIRFFALARISLLDKWYPLKVLASWIREIARFYRVFNDIMRVTAAVTNYKRSTIHAMQLN